MAAWKGAADFRGFPVNLVFEPRKKSSRGPGFKMIGPDGKPPVNKSFEETSGKEITREQIGRAVSIGKGKAAVLRPLSESAIAQITNNEKTKVMEADSLAPVASLPLELALNAYVVLPDPDVAGADRSAAVLFNGLRSTGLAYIAQATISSRDSVIAIYATETEMMAVSLPFVQELYPKPAYEWPVDDAMANVFAQAIEGVYETKPFEHTAFASQYEAKRQEIIDQVLAGQTVSAPAPAPKTQEQPDLMALLQASIGETKASKKTKKAVKA